MKINTFSLFSWKIQDYFTANKNKIGYDINRLFNGSSDYPYQNILKLHQVNYHYVGFYRCVFYPKNSSYEPHRQKIYLFVKGKNQFGFKFLIFSLFLRNNCYISFFISDPIRPFVPVAHRDLTGIKNEDILIPCKPISKEYEVQLFKKNDEVNLQIDFL